MSSATLTVLAIASYEKGHEFLREAKRQGCRVLLLTSESLKDTAQWPREALDDIFYMPDVQKVWNRDDTRKAVSYLAQREAIDRIVPLDDFDLETAAELREHLRLPGLGESQTRYFRDKLAMRMQAQKSGLNVPEFIHILNRPKIHAFLHSTAGPWVLKPRLFAGAIGIHRIHQPDQLWPLLDALGDEQSYFLLERYIPGDVYHVDSIVFGGTVRFAIASRYGRPPLDVAQGGGIFTTRILNHGSEMEQSLLAKNERVLQAMSLSDGVSHTEFILGADGKLYFLETSARVGGAHIAELIEAATGLNLWAEWAKIEVALGRNHSYHGVPLREEYAGLLVSLANQEHADTSRFDDPEIVWRMDRAHHVGFIVRSSRHERVGELLEQYTDRVQREFFATAPAPTRPNQ
ncbi:MAG: ATP-grasp domain-containing protein [Bryobacterales bacterium]|nr:ATP-grasp domain-containing protein [Bryobacterales bacterium]